MRISMMLVGGLGRHQQRGGSDILGLWYK